MRHLLHGSWPRRSTTLLVGAFGALSIGSAGAAYAVAPAPGPACTKVAGPAEAQSSAAFRAFVAGLLAGEVGCLAPGTYGAVGERFAMSTKRPATRITLRALDYASEPRIVGQLLLAGDSITASGLILDGPAGCDSPPPSPCRQMAPLVIDGSDVELNRSEVAHSTSHEGIHVGNDFRAPAPADVRLLDDYVHDNGVPSDPARGNLDYGINWTQGSGLIANSLIDHNNSFGIQLAPFAASVRVTFNTIVGHGRSGVIIADCDPAQNSPLAELNCTTPAGTDLARNNVVDNNIIAGNCTNPAYSRICSGAVAGFLLDNALNGDLVTNNLFFHNYRRKADQPCDGRPGCTPAAPRGLDYSRNMNADPLFAGGSPAKGSARFALRAGSPAVGRAVAPKHQGLVSGSDLAGIERPAPSHTRPDLGAFEFARRPKCFVPALRRLTPAESRGVLRAFHCRLGAVAGHAGRRSHVVAQSPKRGAVRPAGARVRVRVTVRG